MNAPRMAPFRTASQWLGWLVGASVLLWLLLANAPRTYPQLSSHQIFTIAFPAGLKGVGEPIVTTGAFGNGDFLAVRYLDATKAVFVYDVWGMGGPLSQPFDFVPGKTCTLELDLPTLAVVSDFKSHEKRPLRIVLDGRELISEGVYFHRRTADEIYFAANPIGGSTANAEFRGELKDAAGVALRGQIAPALRWPGQLAQLFVQEPWLALAIILTAIVSGYAARVVPLWVFAQVPARDHVSPSSGGPHILRGQATAPHRWAAATILFCGGVFATLITGGTFRFVVEDSFGTFYDHQAASVLHGHLDVPDQALSGEAFIVGGKIYGYFGITPAILRLPFVVAGIAFGKLIRIFMCGYFLAALAAAYALLCQAARVVFGPGRWPSRWATIVFLLSSGLGSTLLFLGSRAYIYHEAVLCGAMFTLWTIFFSLRYLHAPETRNWIGALACGVLAIHARPSSGLFALSLVGVVAAVHAWPKVRALAFGAARRELAVLVLAGLGVLSFNGLSYLKFGTFDGSPLRYSVQYTPERLARFDGKNFHLVNVPHNFDVYFVRPDFRLEPKFPYFFLGARKGRGYPGAKMDLTEPTLALPFAMPELFMVAVLGGLWALAYAPAARRPLLILVVAVTPMTTALLTAIVTSHRYTGDFCPILIATAAWGMAVFDGETPSLRRGFLVRSSLLAAVSIFITLAISLFFQGDYVWGVPDEMKQNYQHLRQRVDGFFGATHR